MLIVLIIGPNIAEGGFFCTFSRNPTVKVSLILKFGPGVDPDPTKPIQNLLRTNLGRLPAPVNQKTLIQSVRIVHPGITNFCCPRFFPLEHYFSLSLPSERKSKRVRGQINLIF